MQKEIKTYARLFNSLGAKPRDVKGYEDHDLAALGLDDVAALHDYVRWKTSYCSYQTYQVSVIHDDGREHRSAPFNFSHEVKFGKIREAEEIMVHVNPRSGSGEQQPLTVRRPELRGQPMVICGGFIKKPEAHDTVFDRGTGARVWPRRAPAP